MDAPPRPFSSLALRRCLLLQFSSLKPTRPTCCFPELRELGKVPNSPEEHPGCEPTMLHLDETGDGERVKEET